MSNAVLAIDQGTTATKALVAAVDGTVLADAEHAVPVHATGDGAVEIHPNDVRGSVVSAGRAALAGAGVPVRAVRLANQGESVVAWRLAGQPPESRSSRAIHRMRPPLASLTSLPVPPSATESQIPSAPAVEPRACAGWATALIERWRTAVTITSNWSTL